MLKIWREIMQFLVLTIVENDGGGDDDGDGSEGGESDIQYAENGDVIGSQNESRVAMMERINDMNDGLRADELQDILDDGSTAEFVVQTAEGSKQALIDDAETPDMQDAAEGFTKETIQEVPIDDAPAKFKIKVNGREIELTQEELVARAQKVESADQYLGEAARIRNEALKTGQPSAEDAGASQVEDDLALVRAIQMGTEEEALAAIQKLKSPAGLSKDDVAKTIDERLNLNQAIARFNNDFKDIVSNPHLHKMVMDKDAELVQAGDTRPYYERYSALGEEVRGFVKDIATKAGFVQQSETPAKVVSTKLEKKEAVQTAPKAAGTKATIPSNEEKEETTQDVIRGMAKARGGPQWLQGMTV